MSDALVFSCIRFVLANGWEGLCPSKCRIYQDTHPCLGGFILMLLVVIYFCREGIYFTTSISHCGIGFPSSKSKKRLEIELLT